MRKAQELGRELWLGVMVGGTTTYVDSCNKAVTSLLSCTGAERKHIVQHILANWMHSPKAVQGST